MSFAQNKHIAIALFNKKIKKAFIQKNTLLYQEKIQVHICIVSNTKTIELKFKLSSNNFF